MMVGLKGFITIVALIAFFQPSFAGGSGRAKGATPAAGAAPKSPPPAAAQPASPASPSGTGAGSPASPSGTGTGSAAPSSGSGAASSDAGAGGAGSIKGTASYYTEWNKAAGSCGFIPGGSDLIAAVHPQYMPAKCNQCIQVNYEGKSIKVKVTDTCPSCDTTKLDLSDNAFSQLAPLSKGILQITWSWVPC